MTNSKVTIIVVHRGNQRYLRDALHCARNAGNQVVLIGDDTNSKDVGWIDFRTCQSEEYQHFSEIYEHMSSNPYKFELICFERYFLTYAYMKNNQLTECVMMDSDICLYEEITRETFQNADLAISIPEQKSEYTMSASAHFSYWKIETMREMLSFLISAYKNRLPKIYEKWDWHKATGTPGGVCDMTLLYLFARQFKGNILNTDLILRPVLYDQVMSDYKNHGIEFLTLKNGHTKAVYKNKDGKICYKSKEQELFPVLYIHAQGGDKRYIFAVSRKKTGAVWMEIGNVMFWINRIYEKLMRCIGVEKRFNWKG